MAGTIRYFGAGHTSKGYYSLYASNLSGLDSLFVISGAAASHISGWLAGIATDWDGSGIEALHDPLDAGALTGVILPWASAAILDGNALRGADIECSCADIRIVSLSGKDAGSSRPDRHPSVLDAERALEEAAGHFALAMAIHDEWEAVYIGNLDFKKADSLAADCARMMWGDAPLGNPARVRHRFMGAATARGPVDFLPGITEGVPRRYFLKGRPGTGKSTLLKKIAAEGSRRGLDLEIYHCGFDPDSLDMVVSRELGTALMDTTAPHEYFPEKDGDRIIDLYELLVKPGTDERYADKLAEITARYREEIRLATACLAQAKRLRDELKTHNPDTSAQVGDILRDISEEILRLKKTAL